MTNKKVLIFAGRQHHFLKLAWLAMTLRQKGYEVKWVMADNMINIDPSVEYMLPLGEPFLHVLDYLDNKSQDWITPAVSEMVDQYKRSGSEIHHYIPPFVLVFSIREITECVYGFRALLSQEQPDVVLVLHENNFWTKMLAYLSTQEFRIPTFGFQEGVLRRRDQTTQNKQTTAAEYVDGLFVWSEDSKAQYTAAGVVSSKLHVVGMPHLDVYHMSQLDPKNWHAAQVAHRWSLGILNTAGTVLFAPPQLNRYEGDPSTVFRTLAMWAVNSGVNLVIRPHPLESSETKESIASMFSSGPVVTDLLLDGTMTLASSDLVLTQQSTVGVEAISLGVPAAEIDLDLTGVLESLAEQGVAHRISGERELSKIREILEGRLNLDKTVLGRWCDLNCGVRDGQASVRVASVLDGVVR